MERTIFRQLVAWKNDPYRKPLILAGARQVGKTYILKQFGVQEYENVAYINCDNNPRLEHLFEDYDMKRILFTIGAIAKTSVQPGKTLIILDEIQELQHGLSALKYFCEEAPEYHIAVAGSLLGITLRHGESAPVGKVDILRIYPMTFEEFLLACGESALLQALRAKDWSILGSVHVPLVQLLRTYYFVGGMPEAVRTYVERNDMVAVRKVQNEILNLYESDMSKHVTPQEATRIRLVWQSIPSQLARENKKFIYGAVKTGARAKDFELSIQWLVDAGLVYRIPRVREVGLPLKFYEDSNAFKLFLLDVGLLGALSQIDLALLGQASRVMTESKGAFTENYVLTMLEALDDCHLYYYSREDSKLEVDFMIQHEGRVIPIEVKAEENLRSKSLSVFMQKHPELKAIRYSMSPYIDQGWMENVPLYAVRL